VSRQSGMVRIFFYNWPIYVGTWVSSLLVLSFALVLHPPLAALIAFGATAALVWSLVSLLVSFYVYDKSQLVSGDWVPALVGNDAKTWATVHAGLDAEVELDDVMPGRCLGRLDIFDPQIMTSPSIKRARAHTAMTKSATACKATALPIADQACDVVVVAFTAHEIRDNHARETFFSELRRSVRPGGKILIVEHLRDVPNFAAFGPGFLHFVARREWLRLAKKAALEIASETRITPWVMALTLQRPA